MGAARSWLQGASVAGLRDGHAFVDGVRRRLEAIETGLLQAAPALREVSHDVRHRIADAYELWFVRGDRSCRIAQHGPSEVRCHFLWDEGEMFRFALPAWPRMAAVLTAWVVDGSPPSALAGTFPWIRLTPLAPHYEAGRPIEGEFIESWNEVEAWYVRQSLVPGPERHALELVRALRRAGFDRTLRAGQSMFTLVVSRSRRHGLRPGQPSIGFDASDAGLRVSYRLAAAGEMSFDTVELHPPVSALLRELASREVD